MRPSTVNEEDELRREQDQDEQAPHAFEFLHAPIFPIQPLLLDHDPTNSQLDNLCFLCMRHHDEYDSREPDQGLNAARGPLVSR